ncbi:HD-GYP domain-containing protein [Aquabacterium sp.]|uniref:HD-GYP domain-containing protein n=1 Tax=Aquabacterium sp. TaxID=1872578 RepID=UPI0035AF23A9
MQKKVATSDLRVGMFVHDLGLSWWQHDFVLPRFPIDTQETLDRILRTKARFIMIDTSKGADVDGAVSVQRTQLAASIDDCRGPTGFGDLDTTLQLARTQVSMDEELRVARKLVREARTAVQSAMKEARTGKISGLPQIHGLAENMVESASRNAGALLSLVGLKEKDDYTFMHCVAVGTFMIALGKQLGMSDDELVDAGTAGLLHDVGKCLVPLDVLNKPGRLTAVEFDLIREHPSRGYRMLRDAGYQDSVALEVVLHHHERLDGKGYPDQLKGDEVTRLARMGAVVDVYDAMGSDRCYRKADPPTSVLKLLLSECGSHFDPVIVHSFIKAVGIYPNGSLVRLHSGRLAVVMEQHPEQALMPKVRVFYSTKSKMPVPTLDLDLSVERGDPIVGYEDPYEWGFDLTKVSGITF